MKGKNIYRKILILVIVIGLLPMTMTAQIFKHYEGIANKSGDYEVIDASKGCLRQKTHECHYYVPVVKGGTVNLTLPIQNFSSTSGGNELEPRGFYRWYNYDTDYKSSHIASTYPATSKLFEMMDEWGASKGLVTYNLATKATIGNVGVTYTRPADSNWQGETVACDVSRYIDCLQNGQFAHESTLSMRYIFHVIPAEQRADDIQAAVLNGVGSKVNDLTFEDNKDVSVGVRDGGSTMSIRLNANTASYYYFHPMSNATKHHVYYNDEKYKILSSDFASTQVFQPTYIQWRVYDEKKSMCVWWTVAMKDSPRFFDLNLNKLNNTKYTAWQKLDGSKITQAEKPTFTYGSRVYVVALAVNGNNMCPIANFAITFYNHYPMRQDQLVSNKQNTRLISYLNEHYRPVAEVSFDDITDGLTLARPTNENDNQAEFPVKWNASAYGFVYRDLIGYNGTGGMWWNPKHSPLHGEYGLYKSANVKGISGSGTSFANNYLWYQGSTLYDRTYENTNGAQYGHFFYVDAADESRQIIEVDFKANLCAGSQVIFSSAIADMTSGGTKPELLFKLYGVHYDDNTGEETERKLLHSFSTGNFASNIDNYATCQWYQGYGKMILPKESGANNYENFKIVVDNMCKSTSGADYAFDDLRIYTKASKIDVLQSTPICPSVDTDKDSTTPTSVQLKLRALQETMAALAEHVDGKKLYFRFVNADGTPVADVNYSSATDPNYKWGITSIYNYVDQSRKVDNLAMYEQVDGEWYVVLANRYFNLQSNKSYYLSLAFDDESISDKNNLEWGKPSDVCSLYSENFQMVQQKVVVTDTNGSITTSVTIPCDDDATPEYNIKAELQTVDQNNGGSINLNGVLFDWYIDDAKQPAVTSSAEFKNVKMSVGEHTIRVVPVSKTTTIVQGGVSYEICLDEMSFKLRVVKNGPQLGFGMDGVTYPSNYTRTVRLGLPQVAALAQQEAAGKGGYLHLPVSGKNFIADNSTKLFFVEEAAKDEVANASTTNVMYLSGTNDPAYQNRLGENLKLAVLKDNYIDRNSNYLAIKFMPQTSQTETSSTEVQLHEGYWYEGILIFREDGTKGTTVLCAGESYIRFEVVPEYVTWNPTASNKMSAAWNNDQNWIRSTRNELYKDASDYIDYVGLSSSQPKGEANVLAINRQNSYVPMKFTKVTIPNLSGLYFPDLGYIAYQKSNGIATKLSNAKGDAATTNIQYAIMAKWDANDEASHGLTADGNLECEPFYGNTCDQIYFKPGGELLDQCYLIYNKAWVEKEMKPNTWYALTSPLLDTYAGDMYVPVKGGKQETEAFLPISFDASINNRVTSPVYQRSWEDASAEEIKLSDLNGSQASHKAYDYAGTGISFDEQNLNVLSANWSHVYNKVDKEYAPMEGFAVKVGDKYTVGKMYDVADAAALPADASVLMRLPKADTQYTYYNKGQSGSTITATVDKAEAYRLVVNEDRQENAMGKMNLPLTKLSDGNNYYLVGNPYMATLSMYKFLKANPALASSFYVYENGALRLYDKLDMSATVYESKNDVTISPMQSFFVRLADGQTADQLNFTSKMTVDREVMGGVKSQAAEPAMLTMKVSDGTYSSEARVVVDAEATSAYAAEEDAQLLYDSNLKEVPTIYTVAGDEVVAKNTLPAIDWLPIGIIAKERASESVSAPAISASSAMSLSFEGIAKMNAPLYLYDADTKQYQQVEDGESIQIQPNAHGRYFLTQTRGTTNIGAVSTEDEAEGIKVYSPASGIIVVSSADATIYNKVEVYTVDGLLVASKNAAGTSSVVLNVNPSSVYIVKVTLARANQVITRKLSIR